MVRPEKKRKVWKALYESERDICAQEISEKQDVSKRCAKKWLKEFHRQGEIVLTRKIGRSKLYDLPYHIP